MNMDRKYKEAENRTSEYLELKYGTDVQSGLSLAEESVFLFLSLSVWDKPDILFSKENTTFVIPYFIFSDYYKYKDSIPE